MQLATNQRNFVSMKFQTTCFKETGVRVRPNTRLRTGCEFISFAMYDSVRIVVCGDDNVGKSSLIASFVKGKAAPNLQKVLAPVTISKSDFFSEDNEPKHSTKIRSWGSRNRRHDKSGGNDILDSIPPTTVIIDTSSSDITRLQRELKRADVIWIVYSDHYTYERILLHWMPMFRSMGVNLPVVVAANKADLDPGSTTKAQNAEEFMPLLSEFKEIEACIRCSAKTGLNVVESFYLCLRAVVFPMSPIFDSKEGNLKPAAVAALKRVFFLCDKDQDGYLNAQEYNDLHTKCFGFAPPEDEFSVIVKTISKVIYPEVDSSGEIPQLISEDGFIILNKIYAERGRHETTWNILRKFHYTDSLSLNDKFLYPILEVNQNSSVELSPTGYKFLVDLFLKFDKDNDGGLNDDELKSLFSPTPGIPKQWQEWLFPSCVVCNEAGYVTLQGWLAQWNLTTFLDYKTTLEYLAYLGFDDDSSMKAIKITRARKKRQKQGLYYRQPVTDRNVFNCFVVGAPKSGKTSLLHLFLRGTYSDVYSPTITPKMGVKDIELRGGKQCYLILEELGELEPAILLNQSRLDQCDVICYTYDSSDPESFQYLLDLRQKHAAMLNGIPSVFAALKADLDNFFFNDTATTEIYTRDLLLSSPLHISSSWPSSLHELFIQLVDAAKMPSTATPMLVKEPDRPDMENFKHIVMAGSAISVMTLVSVWIWRSSVQSQK